MWGDGVSLEKYKWCDVFYVVWGRFCLTWISVDLFYFCQVQEGSCPWYAWWYEWLQMDFVFGFGRVRGFGLVA